MSEQAPTLPELSEAQWKLLERILLDEVIGADDDGKYPVFGQTFSYCRNNLRQDQRKRLTAVLYGEKL